MKTAILLINLGTPDAPTTPAVRRYLREFLTDPQVIDIPWLFRSLLVYGAILPFRPKQSAAAYKKVWTSEGSPLLVHSETLVKGVEQTLSGAATVQLGMRYGSPSIGSALRALLKGAPERLIVLPLYPQFSLAATQSSIDKVKEELQKLKCAVPVHFLPAFYNEDFYLDAVAEVSRPHLANKWDLALFSYHGLPERQVKKTDLSGLWCLTENDCCAEMNSANQNCYRAQCYATTRELARRLEIPKEKYQVSFQSRLGRTPWIQPFTDQLVEAFPSQGIKNLIVFSPSFVADCLETLEEIQIRAQESFLAAGGESLRLVPSLNSENVWIEKLSHFLMEQMRNPQQEMKTPFSTLLKDSLSDSPSTRQP